MTRARSTLRGLIREPGRGVAVVLAILAGLVGAAPAAQAKAKPKPGRPPVVVAIRAFHPRPAIPQDFIGLSFEVKSLPQVAALSGSGDLVRLLRSLGSGVMRFGGVTADTQVAWSDGRSPPPSWATATVSRNDLLGLAQLAQSAGWRILLTVNLGHYDPSSAADEVSNAKQVLGGSLAAIEFGNEPDAYVGMGLRPGPWGFPEYQSQVAAYLNAIGTSGAGLPLAGPDVSTPHRLSWVSAEAAAESPVLLTTHYYPLTCMAAVAPSIGNLVSPRMHVAEKRTLAMLAGASQASRIPLRLDETNNVACGGKAGVSNTFASSLWAVDYVTRAMSAGIAGMNFHDHIGNCLGYSPICALTKADLSAGNIQAEPEWYALLLTHQLVGDRPLPAKVTGANAAISVTAFLSRGGRLHVVVVDEESKGRKPILVHLRLPRRYVAGSVLRLTGPSLQATGGVSLGARGVAPDGSWSAPSQLPRLSARPGNLWLKVSPTSAALATIWRR